MGKKTQKMWAGCHDYYVGKEGIGQTSKSVLVNINDMQGAYCTFPANTAKDAGKLTEAWRYCTDNDCWE